MISDTRMARTDRGTRAAVFGILVLCAGLFLQTEAFGWSGETWGPMNRPTIVSLADAMIDYTWTPHCGIYNFGYGSTYNEFPSTATHSGVAYCQSNPQITCRNSMPPIAPG
jgi:hypothetical protein